MKIRRWAMFAVPPGDVRRLHGEAPTPLPLSSYGLPGSAKVVAAVDDVLRDRTLIVVEHPVLAMVGEGAEPPLYDVADLARFLETGPGPAVGQPDAAP